MKRSELEHLIRAAGSIANDSEIVVIGSQAILGQFPDAPSALLVSAEADLFPLHHPEDDLESALQCRKIIEARIRRDAASRPARNSPGLDKFDRIFQLHSILANRRTPIDRGSLMARLECSSATLFRIIAR